MACSDVSFALKSRASFTGVAGWGQSHNVMNVPGDLARRSNQIQLIVDLEAKLCRQICYGVACSDRWSA